MVYFSSRSATKAGIKTTRDIQANSVGTDIRPSWSDLARRHDDSKLGTNGTFCVRPVSATIATNSSPPPVPLPSLASLPNVPCIGPRRTRSLPGTSMCLRFHLGLLKLKSKPVRRAQSREHCHGRTWAAIGLVDCLSFMFRMRTVLTITPGT